MSIAIPTTSTLTWSSSNTWTITKPTSLAVGDLMVAQIVTNDGAGAWTPPSGWTVVVSLTSGTNEQRIYQKVADSADVAASNFTWTNGNTAQRCGGIARITGFDTTTPITYSTSYQQDNTFSPQLGTTITPESSSLLMQFAFCFSGGSAGSMSSYTNDTSAPTYTETWDVDDASFRIMGMASGMRTQSTATGNFTASGGVASSDWIGCVISINTYKPVISETLTTTDSQTYSNAMVFTETITETDTLTTEEDKWNNTNKSATTWTNLSK